MSAVRKKLAKECGADVILDPKECDVIAEIKKLTKVGADVSFECIGNKLTAPLAIEAIRNNGKAVIVGIFEEAQLLQLLQPQRHRQGCYRNPGLHR